MVIAVTGKGGTGKTLIAGLLVRLLAKKYRVLAVDADPDANLGEALGVESYKTLGEIREIFQHSRDDMISINKESWLEGKIYGEVIYEAEDFDLLVMGRPEGEGCYCFANNLLRAVLRKLMRHYDVIIVDCEAGLEHISRRTIDGADIILIVTDASRKGLMTAKRIRELAEELNLRARIYLIANRVEGSAVQAIEEFAKIEGFSLLDIIPPDEEVTKADIAGVPVPLSSEVAKKVEKLAEVLVCEANS
ncbi:ATP-binding protein [Archaeoglobus veneficus]|uniref:Cobyrinic acid ac-diamide synthase n=1 Tax=Archaeoglobus veneficus (strain DSM 11195 / SNP6) TaxID=693661 RepID=F2KTA4_ARCVS|nr:AAA family ATPase [Archaeoglobus veneficus]AEA47134.1 Cobyrinic acid ac-diamide synthase [Archaeoglobus veneficus SNP6]